MRNRDNYFHYFITVTKPDVCELYAKVGTMTVVNRRAPRAIATAMPEIAKAVGCKVSEIAVYAPRRVRNGHIVNISTPNGIYRVEASKGIQTARRFASITSSFTPVSQSVSGFSASAL